MFRKLKSKKGLIVLLLLITVVLGACGNKDNSKDEPVDSSVEEDVEDDDGLRTELHIDEENLLSKKYVDFTERERKLFDTLEKGSTISNKLKESIKDDVSRLSEEKEVVLKEEEVEKEKAMAAYKKREEDKQKEKEKEEPQTKETDKESSEVSLSKIEETILYNIGDNDVLSNLKYNDRKISMSMKIDGQIGTEDLSKDFAIDRYGSVSDSLIEMNKKDNFWDELIINFSNLKGVTIGEVKMNYKDRESGEFGDFFSVSDIEKQLNK